MVIDYFNDQSHICNVYCNDVTQILYIKNRGQVTSIFLYVNKCISLEKRLIKLQEANVFRIKIKKVSLAQLKENWLKFFLSISKSDRSSNFLSRNLEINFHLSLYLPTAEKSCEAYVPTADVIERLSRRARSSVYDTRYNRNETNKRPRRSIRK